jgi:hypothetical protein
MADFRQTQTNTKTDVQPNPEAAHGPSPGGDAAGAALRQSYTLPTSDECEGFHEFDLLGFIGKGINISEGSGTVF